ncbi:class I tRNA ligase family protein [Candidatus Nesciobacter abundans]|uniref:leucine--tRNA ligase n=1 Tax=Candidatus Nesciobacter abundans TaxID=2601668 RepID=A0A5C0UGV1_9PROT|nr:class I tRNA ligase family protein [Candidatus Nesciobacter abundans]QEK38927.1 leucine--tRNA ligase [Candidatus Nesciobacter abundans]
MYRNKLKEIENKSTDFWNKLQINKSEISNKEPYVILDFFPYPSGFGLHVGHTLGYISTDVKARFERMNDKNVLYAMGFDSFGLPAEQYAIQTNQHPEITTQQNISNMKKQLKALALSHDESRTFNTSDSDYYKWTQWMFLKMYDSFFDNIEGKAKPISDLVEMLDSGKFTVENGKLYKASNSVKSINKDKEEIISSMRLAFLEEVEVNWCPKLGTVLSNEEVKNGLSERGNYPVEKRPMKQWMIRITSYAERLNKQLDILDWPQNIVSMQKNWIGEQEGTEIVFSTKKGDIKIFTTKPQTLYGVTFLAISSKHPVLGGMKVDENKFTNIYAKHPITNEEIPIWTADYVYSDYGTGAVMAVPAHDQRDFEFAKENDIKIKSVLKPDYKWLEENYLGSVKQSEIMLEWENNPDKFSSAFEGRGNLIDIEQFDVNEFLSINKEKNKVLEHLLDKGFAKQVKMFKLRDWLFSRQRYWGEPFPIVYDSSGKVFPICEEELPVELPKQHDFSPREGNDPEAPLGRSADWKSVKGSIVNGKFTSKVGNEEFTREINTMPNWAGSCWYYLRYMDPTNKMEFISKEAMEYWSSSKVGAIDMYVGGAEHAVLHLLYARFWHMFLFDLGYVKNKEPFDKLLNPGMITADAYKNGNDVYIDINDVEIRNKKAYQISTGELLVIEPGKMGKRYKNGIDPQDMCDKYGIDVFRLHVMYMAPITQTRNWNSDNIIGMERFLSKVYSKISSIKLLDTDSDENLIHKTIKFVTKEMEEFRFNTAIATLIKFVNDSDSISLSTGLSFLKMLFPFAPHLSEYLYQLHRNNLSIFDEVPDQHKEGLDSDLIDEIKNKSICMSKWPEYDDSKTKNLYMEMPITINGRLRDKINVPVDLDESEIEKLVMDREKIKSFVAGKNIRKSIVIKKKDPKDPDRLISMICNLVI